MSRLPRLLIALAGVLMLAPILFTMFACRSLIYHPTLVTDAHLDALGGRPQWQRSRVEVERDRKGVIAVNGLVRTPTASTSLWLLFFGGNAADIASNAYVLEMVREHSALDLGLAVFAYRGYDGSGGRPSERALVADAERIARELAESRGVERLVVVGQSLGTSVAAQLAARLAQAGRAPAGVILLSPFLSMSKVFDEHVPLIPVGWALSDRFLTEAIADQIRSPVLIIHGDADDLIPVHHGKGLAARIGEKARLVVLSGRGHNDLWDDPRTLEAIKSFLAAL
jgi:pimeloyl-ACP methyl ester carboxylesterase